MEFEKCLGQFQLRERWGRQWTVTRIQGKNWKTFKTYLWNIKHTFFATETSRQSVARVTHQNTSSQKIWKKKIAKRFSWLEVSLARESRVEPRKSLCTPRDWTFHSWTSHQNRPASSRLWYATWMTQIESPKQGNTIFEIFSFCKNKIPSKNT